ncbi:Uncharacterised protein [BD1-7 clade bacterium]|uniref:DUF2169 domain-containing protein n=1 Tax=BD1-7 clade bacterium TaxID=2029982 RepID=A0A5S9QUW8_9GAMM|nr:Uncharacterised protein [BD1-7 clade bacterium]
MLKAHICNPTPFAASFTEHLGEDNQPMLTVSLKCCYDIVETEDPEVLELEAGDASDFDEEGERRKVPPTIFRIPPESSPMKPSTDVLLYGTAVVPGPDMESYETGIRILGEGDEEILKHHAQIFGPRVWRINGKNFSLEIVAMAADIALDLMFAFGGFDMLMLDLMFDGGLFGLDLIDFPFDLMFGEFPALPALADMELPFHLPNPLGIGFHMEGFEIPDLSPLPLIECILDLIATPWDKPQTINFGYHAPEWEPRNSKFGSMSKDWVLNICPLYPEDFDPGFWQEADPDMITDEYLKGDETLVFTNIEEPEERSCELPDLGEFKAEMTINGKVQEADMQLDGVWIELDRGKLRLFYRANFTGIGSLHHVGRIDIIHEGKRAEDDDSEGAPSTATDDASATPSADKAVTEDPTGSATGTSAAVDPSATNVTATAADMPDASAAQTAAKNSSSGNLPDLEEIAEEASAANAEETESTTGIPDADLPDADLPEIDVPSTDLPETDIPSADIPETDIPSADIPDAETPSTDYPDSNMADQDLPSSDSDYKDSASAATDKNGAENTGKEAPKTPDANKPSRKKPPVIPDPDDSDN